MLIRRKIKILLAALLLCVTLQTPLTVRAQADYGCDTYGAGDYGTNDCSVAETPSEGTPKPDGGGLSNTGRSILLFGGIGVLGTAGGGALLYATLKKRKK